eukprot:CAMPEP_0116871282 /NCGR_PEP_ID=MMETSP0463-20121206/1545_1 /TAXON_ID=181622 /ORGANISM="Strombidinopsis sp, Strain SopsisLIS2011" /LENGTH=157 /DNA_ID=CAMNT_0004509373 /DNA_START=4078 /DNA_END=4551 /DNA_ORIENTATION=+
MENTDHHEGKDSDREKQATTQQYISKDEASKMDVSPRDDKQKEFNYYDRSEAEYGNISSRDPKLATGQQFYNKPENNYGTAQDFSRSVSADQDRNLISQSHKTSSVQEVTSDGRSASTEGEIAYHSAFTKADLVKKPYQEIKKESDTEVLPAVVEIV